MLLWLDYFKVKGDNYRRTKSTEAGSFAFEIGCDLFVKKGENYTEMDKWWLLDVDDMMKEIEDPVVVRVTSKRSNFIFKDSWLEK